MRAIARRAQRAVALVERRFRRVESFASDQPLRNHDMVAFEGQGGLRPPPISARSSDAMVRLRAATTLVSSDGRCWPRRHAFRLSRKLRRLSGRSRGVQAGRRYSLAWLVGPEMTPHPPALHSCRRRGVAPGGGLRTLLVLLVVVTRLRCGFDQGGDLRSLVAPPRCRRPCVRGRGAVRHRASTLSAMMSPWKTHGATRPSRRRPATKVVVFQSPCGTTALSLSPLGAARSGAP